MGWVAVEAVAITVIRTRDEYSRRDPLRWRTSTLHGPLRSDTVAQVARSPLRLACPIDIDAAMVSGLLNVANDLDRRFDVAWRTGLDSLTPSLRTGALPGVTGHVAESVVEVMLAERGYVPMAHHAGPGRHGVDLIVLHLDQEMVFAVEVKGTLRARRVPRLTRGELEQMSAAWVGKPDNPGMTDAGLQSGDVYGAVAAVNFADMSLRVAMTADFATLRPVIGDEQLDDPSWLRLDGRPRS